MKVLIVDDEQISQMSVAGAVRSLGHEVFVAGNGLEALNLLAKEEVGVVVSDWRMPVMDGLELCRSVRKGFERYTYFILLSVAEISDENYDAALRAEVDDFLPKPVSRRELLGRLHVAERILRFTRQVRQLESYLPICAHCRRVRDDKNYWQQIEGYINERAGTHFSHGVCPDCYQKHVVPEFRAMGMEPPKIEGLS
ncbi:MAG TPA: response regulator [Candidatus Didemnitutus sp.]|nr:response regulator [Candidatus Didemnitutus sp.]